MTFNIHFTLKTLGLLLEADIGRVQLMSYWEVVKEGNTKSVESCDCRRVWVWPQPHTVGSGRW